MTKLRQLLDRRNNLKKKEKLDEEDDELISFLEEKIADECEDENRKKIMENFNDLDGNNGNLNHQGVWNAKKKYFPKISEE